MTRKKTRKKAPFTVNSPIATETFGANFRHHRLVRGLNLSPTSRVVGDIRGARNLKEILDFACEDHLPCRVEKMIGSCSCALHDRIHLEHVCMCGEKFIR